MSAEKMAAQIAHAVKNLGITPTDSDIIVLGVSKKKFGELIEEHDCYVQVDKGLTEVEAGTATAAAWIVEDEDSLEKFDKMRDAIVALLEIRDEEALGAFLRRNIDNKNRGLLRTILVTIKPFREAMPSLKPYYEIMAKRLKGTFKKGDRVEHDEYGLGTIVLIESAIEVVFDDQRSDKNSTVDFTLEGKGVDGNIRVTENN